MKTTVEIDDHLFRQAKLYAAREGLTLRELVEAGLTHAIKKRAPRRQFKLKPFKGNGLQPGIAWDKLLKHAYEDEVKRWSQLTRSS